MTGEELPEGNERDVEAAPFCQIGPHPETGDRVIAVKMGDGDGGLVTGYVSAQDARDITLALRATAAEIDGKPFFDGGWSTAEAVRYAASELEELSEQYHMKTRSIENSNFEGSRVDE
jgi:hypothetical protein